MNMPIVETTEPLMTGAKFPDITMSASVIAAINGELHYQSKLQDMGRSDGIESGLPGQLVTLSVYVRKAQEAWVMAPGDPDALEQLRKVAAIAIRALEQYGCPIRKMPGNTEPYPAGTIWANESQPLVHK